MTTSVHWTRERVRRSALWSLLLCIACAFCIEDSVAEGFTVRTADTNSSGRFYRLDALIDYQIGPVVIDALRNGVPITVLVEIEVLRPRAYLWDETALSTQWRWQLRYQALTQGYAVRNLTTGAEAEYPTLAMALAAMGRITDLPIAEKQQLGPASEYTVQLRASLDLDALPVPLRLMAYVSSDWRLGSEWYAWPLH